ncbi:hypothetical protein OKW28_001375 [Paraburkholderia sp. 40]
MSVAPTPAHRSCLPPNDFSDCLLRPAFAAVGAPSDRSLSNGCSRKLGGLRSNCFRPFETTVTGVRFSIPGIHSFGDSSRFVAHLLVSRLPGCRPHPLLKLIRRNRLRIQKALRKVTTHGGEKITLIRRLDPLGNNLQSQLVSEHDHCFAERLIAAVEAEVLYE